MVGANCPGINRQIYRGRTVSMARFFGKIVKKLAPELCKVLNSTLQGKKGQKIRVIYVLVGANWAGINNS